MVTNGVTTTPDAHVRRRRNDLSFQPDNRPQRGALRHARPADETSRVSGPVRLPARRKFRAEFAELRHASPKSPDDGTHDRKDSAPGRISFQLIHSKGGSGQPTS